MSGNFVISPIAIDLGAKNTGVYFAHYPEGSPIKKIEKEGKVYQLEKDSYTLLMANRTAKRHQRRGFDRRQMVKRLFKLIWEKHFGLEWDKNTQQTTSFLLNRRGFSFLTEEYDAETLSRFPEEAYKLLPDALKIESNGNEKYDFASALREWANEEESRIKSSLDAIKKEPEQIQRRLVLIGKTKKLREYCSQRTKGQTIPEETRPNLSRLSKWILKEWVNKDVRGLPATPSSNSVDLVAYLNNEDAGTAQKILNSLTDYASEEEELKDSVWNFNVSDFDIEKAKFDQSDKLGEGATTESERKEHKKWLKTHLWHLAFALHKIHEEFISGGRHRSKYFEEVKSVLENTSHTHCYLKTFCRKLQAGSFEPLNEEKLTNLIGHLSNLELKPLRKYFNDKGHKSGDYWDEQRLKKFFDRWILREWRVNLEKDKKKASGEPGDYKKLCQDWKAHQCTVVDFWLKTDPVYTIPPYQDSNNRRPPRCQSLILNPAFLDNHYSEWQTWLGILKDTPCVKEHLDNYEEELNDIKSGKGRSYFSDEVKGELKKDSGRRTLKDLNARLLQFIFDRVKADDPLNLNEIYSHAKKYRQWQSTEQERKDAKNGLEKAIKKSELQDILKTPRDYQSSAVFDQGSFLHLICKYYKIRQKAKDGRLFIHPEYRDINGRGYENTGRFDDKDRLLTYCNHKPRQKRHQMLGDLAGLLQIAPKQLEEFVQQRDGKTVDEKLSNWLNSIDHLKTNCARAAKEQKDRRGRLKLDIQKIFERIYHRRQNESPSAQEIKEILKNSSVDEASKLHSFCERAKDLCSTVTRGVYEDSKQRQWEQDLKRNPATAVYLLAQINNIAFKERSGNANTCAVCSTDNAQRMQMRSSANGNESNAKAQRLPAIETRLIDGAVMRLARIVGSAIAEDKWGKIEGELRAGKYVCVPIITESNRFEFEPSLKEIKGKTLKDVEKKNRSEGRERISVSKDERIKESSLGICPYTGDELGDAGDKDHIVPRSSEWGSLNDEANLIWASDKGNKEVKKDNEFSLADLNTNYKQKQFETSNDLEIKQRIIEQIGDGEGENFKFGPYRSFINLTPDQQKAFRHALFLVGDPLRNKVIRTINNRTRTFVNGTQRYFAEVLANNLHKKARAIGRQDLLSFDYFGVEAQDSSRGGGIYHLRKWFETVDPEVRNYRKDNGKTQEPCSHLIDAQLAFAIVADAHRNEGGLKIKINDSVSLWPVDGMTNTLSENIFNAVKVSPEEMSHADLGRRKAYEVETHHRQLLNDNRPQRVHVSYQIHRDSIISERFFPLIRCRDGKMKKGFHPDNAVSYTESNFQCLRPFLQEGKNTNRNYDVWVVKKKQAQEFLMEVGERGASQTETRVAKLLDGLSYQTVKKSIQFVLSESPLSAETKKRVKGRNLTKETEEALLKSIKSPPETVEDTLRAWECFIYEDKFKKDKVLLPIFNEWLRLKTKLEQADKDQALQVFLKSCDVFCNTHDHPHKKVRKVYSLPVVATIGNIRLKRKAWDGSTIVQTVPEESLAKYGDAGHDRPHSILNKNSIPKKHYTGIPSKWSIEARKWISVPLEEREKKENADKTIIGAQIINKDADRCIARLTVSSIENLSLPKDKKNWKGKIVCHEDVDSLKKAQKENGEGKHHCLSSEWHWFKKPFALPQDRREVEFQTSPDGNIVITFTVSKSKELKQWLSGSQR